MAISQRAGELPKGALVPGRRKKRTALSRLLHHRGVLVGGIVLLAVVLSAILAPLLTSYDPVEQQTSLRLEAPSAEHPFGTDNLGRDLLSRVLYGGRYSLSIGLGAVLVAFALAMVVGIICTFLGGWFDIIMMRVVDALIAFPTLLLSLVFVALFGSGLIWVLIAVGIGVFPRMTRLIRSSVLEKKNLDFVDATRALGANNAWIIRKHILPNVLAPILVSLTFETGTAIMVEASLGFLGLGIQPPTPTWGSIISEGRRYLRMSPYATIFSALFISMALLALNLLGDGLRDYFDPRLRHENK